MRQRYVVTVIPAGVPVASKLEISIDVLALARAMGRRAVKSNRGRATALSGAVMVKHLGHVARRSDRDAAE